MCTIVISRKKANLPKIIADAAAANNPHGFGVGIIRDASHVYPEPRGIVECKIFWEYNPEVPIGASRLQPFGDKYIRGYMVHFRRATHGEISQMNIQPFVSASKEWLFAHSGIFWDYAKNDSEKSDSLLFFEQIEHLTLAEFSREWKNIKKYAEECGSKIAVLAENGDIFHTSGFFYIPKYEIITSDRINEFENIAIKL